MQPRRPSGGIFLPTAGDAPKSLELVEGVSAHLAARYRRSM